MSSMLEIAEDAAGTVIDDVLSEAADELSGRSGKKWAVILLSLLLGVAIATFVAKRLRSDD